jgi:hypothetical protein
MAVIAGGLTLVAGIWTRKLAWDPEVTMVRGEVSLKSIHLYV